MRNAKFISGAPFILPRKSVESYYQHQSKKKHSTDFPQKVNRLRNDTHIR